MAQNAMWQRKQMLGLPQTAWGGGILAGIAVGGLYGLSPATVWFLLALPALFVWAGHGLGPRERRWIFGVLGAAVLLRLLVIAGLFLLGDHVNEAFAVLFGDERAIEERSLWTLNLALRRLLAPFAYELIYSAYGKSSIYSVFGWWQYWVGPAPYGIRLVNMLMWLTAAVALHRTARRAFGQLPALAGLVALLFMPTLFVWSLSVLKEPVYFLLTTCTIVGAMTFARGASLPARLLGAVAACAAVGAMMSLRSIGPFVSAGGLLAAAVLWTSTRRAWIGAIVLVIAVAGCTWAVRSGTVRTRVMPQLRLAAVVHIGHVRTPGYAYQLLDRRFYSDFWGDPFQGAKGMSHAEMARFVVRAAASVLTVPLPWEAASLASLVLLPQQVAWYILALLAAAGIAAGGRRDPLFTWLLVGTIGLGAAVVSLFNGNVGTLVRMRDSIVPLVVWLSAIGACAVLEWTARCFSRGPQHAHSR
jgi:hypothetical protein